MITLALSDTDKKEGQILELALKQCGIEIMPIDPSSRFYIKMLQYRPNVVMIDIPQDFLEVIHFVKLIKQHLVLRKTLIIGFGILRDKSDLALLMGAGLNYYLARPLKIGQIIQLIERHTKVKIDSLKNNANNKDNTEFNEDILFDSETLPLKKISLMVERVSKLLAFPFTVPRVLKITSDVNAGASELAKVILGDPVISTQILKVSNAVFFSSLNRRISTIKDAIVRIGFNETKRIVIGMSVMNLLSKEMHNSGFDRMEYWLHSLGCAIIAERLARRIGQLNPDEVFLAGLIHGFGLLLMDEYFPVIISKILKITTEHGTEFYDEENVAMKINHIDFTTELFEEWKIPEIINRAITNSTRFLPEDLSNLVLEQKMSLILCVADIFMKTIGIGMECDQFIRPVPNEIMRMFKMTSGLNQLFIADISREIDFYAKFFKIEQQKNNNQYVYMVENIQNISICIINLAGDIFVPPLAFMHRAGASVTLLTEEGAGQNTATFHLVIFWCLPETTVEKLDSLGKKFLCVEKNTILVAFIDENSDLADNSGLKEFLFIPQQIDMRKIERILREAMNGTKLPFEKYSAR